MLQNVDTAPIVAPVQQDHPALRPASEQDPEGDFMRPVDTSVQLEGAETTVPGLALPGSDRCRPDPAAGRAVDLHFRPEALPV